MRTRVLLREEWHLVGGTPLALVLPQLPPGARIVVAEDGGAIVGTWAVVPYLHLEGMWVDPRHRRAGGVLRRLMRGVRSVCRELGILRVLTCSDDAQITKYLFRLGAEQLPGEHFVLETSCL